MRFSAQRDSDASQRGGFTLIELLVVISIIALLSSVVLSSLSTARGRAADTVIKSNLANIRAQAALIYSSSACYGDGDAGDTSCAVTPQYNYGANPSSYAPSHTVCIADTRPVEERQAIDADNTIFNNPTVTGMIRAAAAASGRDGLCSSNAKSWAVSFVLKSDAKKAWCVDSSGNSIGVSSVSDYVDFNSLLPETTCTGGTGAGGICMNGDTQGVVSCVLTQP